MSTTGSIFISYSHANREFVERLSTDLQAQGIPIWIDRQALKVGTSDWEQVLREAIRASVAILLIASPASRQSRYVQGELNIAEMYDRPVFPVWADGEQWADCIPMERIKTQYVDARASRYTAALREMIEILGGVTSPLSGTPHNVIAVPLVHQSPLHADDRVVSPIRNPYKGLRAFTNVDAGDFFGREKLIDELTTTIGALTMMAGDDPKRLMVIVGPSGSGKSSVIMAGLLPRLRGGALPGSDRWIYLDPIVPGVHPIESLMVTLANAFPARSLVSLQEDLDNDSTRSLHLLARHLSQHPAQNPAAQVVLLVDQFEELFTQTIDQDERQHFIDLLVSAATEPHGTVLILLTLRADFYDRPMQYPALGRLIEACSKSVLPMELDDLRAVIERPAALPEVRLHFEDGLIGDLLFEVRGEPAPLPLLQFTLDQLFERRDGHQLTRAAYQAIGGVRGALAKQAESTYASLPSDEHRRLTRSLFLRLIEPGTTAQDTTRRRAPLSELALTDPVQSKLIRQCAETFIAARLLLTNTIANLQTIEVSHEALIREWTRLGDWLREARDDIRLQQMLSRDATAWLHTGQRLDDVYRGQKLLEAQTWASRGVPNADEMAFIDAGLSNQQDQAQSERERQQRELALAKQAVENAQRAEAAEKDRAIRFEKAARQSTRVARLAALTAGIALGAIVYMLIYTHQVSDVLTQRANVKIDADRALLTPIYIYTGVLIAFLAALIFHRTD